MKKSSVLLYLLIGVIILFTQFYHPVNGLADDQIGLVTAEKVIQNITPVEGYRDLMERYIETGGLHPSTAYGLPWINPIYTLVTHTYSSLVGLSIPKWHFLSVILFVGMIFFAKKLGDFFFGRYGFIFPLLLATNLYILVVVRNSILLFSLSLITQFGAIYYFLKIHEKFNKRDFILTLLFLFLALSNGSTYSPVTYLYLYIVLLALILWKLAHRVRDLTANDFQFLRKKYYFFIFAIIPILSIISYFANDLMLNITLGSSLDSFLYFTKSKFPPTEFPTLSDKITGSIIKFKEVFLGTSFREIFGPHATFFPYRSPVLDKAAAILFILGLLSFFKEFTYKKLILLLFLIYTFYNIYGVGAARIFIVFVPFLLLIASSGFVFLIQTGRMLKINGFIRVIFLSALGILLAYNVYFFENYFVVRSNSNLMLGTGVAEIKSYIDAINTKKMLVFMAPGYPTWYLADFKGADFTINNTGEKNDFRKKIEELKGRYDDVILIFPSYLFYVDNPGVLANYGIWNDFENNYRFFQDAFPELANADKIVYSYQGIPQHYLYRLSKYRELPKAQRLVFKDPSETFVSNSKGEIRALKIRGGINKLRLGNSQEVIVNSSPSTEVLINFGEESLYSFYHSYGDDSFKENLNQKEKLEIDKKFKIKRNGTFVWIEPNISPDQPPYLLEYIFDLPYQIKKVEVKNDARLFNSTGGQTVIRGYMVDQEKYFSSYLKSGNKFSFLKISSDNSNTYGPGGEINVLSDPNWGIGRLSSYTVLKPKNTQKILLSLLLEGKYYNPGYFLANFYSIGNSSFFKFTLDTKNLTKPKIGEGEKISIEKNNGEANSVAVDIIYN